MLANEMIRKTQGIARKTQFKSQSTKATILKYSKKTDFDHLGLRDPSKQTRFRVISNKMTQKGDPKETELVFSDYFYKYDPMFNKTQVMVMVTDHSLYVFQVGRDYKVVNFIKIKDLY